MNFLDVVLIFFLVLVMLNYCVHRSVLYPPFIFCSMWLFDLVVLRSGIIEVDPVHNNTLAIVAAGAASFSAGGLLARLTPRKLFRIDLFPSESKERPIFFRNLILIILLCGLPILIHETLRLGQLGGGSGFNLLAQARVALNEAADNGESQSFVMNWFTWIAILSSMLLATEKRDLRFWTVAVIALIGCIVSTGRTNLLLLIAGLSAIHLLQTNRESLFNAMRLLRWPIALFVMLYIALIFTNKNTEEMSGGIADIALYFVFSYIAGPLAAFDRVVQHPADFMRTTSHTFQFPLHLAAALHLTSFTAPPKLDSFVFVPFPTNVYTVFKFYFLELGIAGTVLVLFLIGLFHSLLYLKAKEGGRMSLYLFGVFIYSVLMVIFDDNYYNIGEHLRVIAFGLFYFRIGSIPFRLFPATKVRRIDNPRLESSGV